MKDRVSPLLLRRLLIYFATAMIIFLSACYKAVSESPYHVSEIQSLVSRAERSYERGEIERAINLYREALLRSRLIQDDRTSLIILINLSRLLSLQGKIQEAENSIETSKALLERATHVAVQDSDLLDELKLEDARIIFIKRELTLFSGKANSLSQPGLEIIEGSLKELINSKNISIKIRSLNLLARIYLKKEQLQEAETLAFESLNVNRFSGSSKRTLKIEEANSHRILGEVYLKRGDFIKGERHFLNALSIDRDLAIPVKIGIDIESLARFYKEIGDLKKARHYYIRSIEIWRGLGLSERLDKTLKELEELDE